MMIKKLLTLLLLVGLTCQIANAERVTRVIDGDTVILSETGRARLSGIDAPELKQLGGNESKMFLQILTSDREIVCVKATTADRYNRSLCELYAGSINLLGTGYRCRRCVGRGRRRALNGKGLFSCHSINYFVGCVAWELENRAVKELYFDHWVLLPLASKVMREGESFFSLDSIIS